MTACPKWWPSRLAMGSGKKGVFPHKPYVWPWAVRRAGERAHLRAGSRWGREKGGVYFLA